MNDEHKFKDKPIDWVILVGSIVFIAFGLATPALIFFFGDIDISDWTMKSWQPYACILCLVVYFAFGKVAIDMRKDYET